MVNLIWKSRLVAGRPSIMYGWICDMMMEYKPEELDALEQLPSLWVIMSTIMIHLDFREAAQTGLFGLLGDAPVQIVPASDKKRASALYDLADPSGKEIQREYSELEMGLEEGCVMHEISEKLSSKLHAAIMFRLCTPNCKVYKKWA